MITLLLKLLKKLLSFFVRHSKITLFGGAAVAVGTAVPGGINAHKAKKINKEALSIQRAALEKHDNAYDKLQQNLAKLGQAEKTAIDSFDLFAETIEKIQGKPRIRTPLLSRVKLPNYEPDEFRQLSTGIQTAIGTGVGAGAGALAGLAAFGASAVVAAPAMITAGVVLCVKGCGLKKKAIENKKQAIKMSESVDEIVAFYSQLGKTADSYCESVSMVYNKYMWCLSRTLVTLTQKTTWKEFSREEKKNVENAVLLARLLFQMCKAKLVIQQDDAEKVEAINTSEIHELQKYAHRRIAECN